ncbi:MAG: hypothetical protein ISS25_02580 [Nanoarchaeota archaeon]|nr:hypothetical protein [DPANN group archaeon]MBL7116691.1 hypothetical protein [Nanoarchaeota archaeon]
MNWQDYRKKFIFIANHINTVFGEEISKRKNISFEDICFYTRKDLIELLDKNKRVDISKRKKAFVTIYNEGGGIEYLEGDEALAYSKPFLETRVNDIKEIKGLVVSKGKKNVIKGKARIVLTPKESSHFKHGDILVAPMTSPDFVTVMRKAAAIITDEGGMTSHAAIVSRELGIPCIVGTKIATKVLKDGDLVEVDADKGIVRRIK